MLFVDYPITYSCGKYPHRGTVTLPMGTPESLVRQILDDLSHSLCPGCQLEEMSRQAYALAQHKGLKRLIGKPECLSFAEQIRARLFVLFASTSGLRQEQLVTLFNHPYARSGRLWLNCRDALWDEARRFELLVELHLMTNKGTMLRSQSEKEVHDAKSLHAESESPSQLS